MPRLSTLAFVSLASLAAAAPCGAPPGVVPAIPEGLCYTELVPTNLATGISIRAYGAGGGGPPNATLVSAPGGGDKVRAMQDKARAVQSAITSTLNKATERDGLLEELQYKSVKLEKSAAGFSSGAATLRRGACCKLYGIYFFLLLVLALVVGIALLVTKYQYHMW